VPRDRSRGRPYAAARLRASRPGAAACGWRAGPAGGEPWAGRCRRAPAGPHHAGRTRAHPPRPGSTGRSGSAAPARVSRCPRAPRPARLVPSRPVPLPARRHAAPRPVPRHARRARSGPAEAPQDDRGGGAARRTPSSPGPRPALTGCRSEGSGRGAATRITGQRRGGSAGRAGALGWRESQAGGKARLERRLGWRGGGWPAAGLSACPTRGVPASAGRQSPGLPRRRRSRTAGGQSVPRASDAVRAALRVT